MPGIDDGRRTLSELQTLHGDIEPGLRDIIVEGRKDARFYARLLHEARVPFSRIFAVDDRVHIDSELVLQAGGEIGPRGRVLGLAAQVEQWGLESPGITCIVDSDRDCFRAKPEFEALLFTDFASVEGYVLQEAPLDRLLSVGLGCPENARDVLEWLVPALNELFLVRAVLHEEGPEVPLIPKYLNCCTGAGSSLRVDSEDLVVRSLHAERLSAERGRLLAALERRRSQLPADPRTAARGHDIGPILLHGLGIGRAWPNPEHLDALIAVALRPDDFEGHQLLQALRTRLT